MTTDLRADFDELRDITVIGAGPVGLCTAFWAGMRQASVRIIDSLPELGGQLMALYPEKYVYDVGGFPRISASVERALNALDGEPISVQLTG